MTALRDFAPYAYSFAALLAYLLPVADGARQRSLVYGCLAFHVGWIIVPGHLPAGVFDRLVLGGAPIFTTRPDIDSAVLGIGIALALKDLLLHGGQHSFKVRALLGGFVAASAYAVGTQPTRAGLLSCAVTVIAVLALWWRRASHAPAGRFRVGRRALLTVVALASVAAIAMFTPPGQRLSDGLSSRSSQAAGTIQVREATWRGVTDYITFSGWRTGAGVGFGPDFIEASGTSYALEGTEYKDVRSPHNYLVGTFARLGLIGALLALLVLVGGALAGLKELAQNPGTVTTLASLVLLAVPVVALLGVILESPFGAIPYFWALGHVAAQSIRRDRTTRDSDPATEETLLTRRR